MKMKKADYAVHIFFIILLIVLSIFWGCKYDILITVLGLVIAGVSILTTFYQYKKMSELEEPQKEE